MFFFALFACFALANSACEQFGLKRPTFINQVHYNEYILVEKFVFDKDQTSVSIYANGLPFCTAYIQDQYLICNIKHITDLWELSATGNVTIQFCSECEVRIDATGTSSGHHGLYTADTIDVLIVDGQSLPNLNLEENTLEIGKSGKEIQFNPNAVSPYYFRCF